ncbi:unnamed protein product [Hydatigera taeniaeformis]|uniref:Uncharacterized protein n=1 Tax=Hydatigena taeniaeformis TaxID=6205 RepID=A0A0R3WX50_HYDTA|nr:unnamed protein product [Hydatigera taeniaeformis]
MNSPSLSELSSEAEFSDSLEDAELDEEDSEDADEDDDDSDLDEDVYGAVECIWLVEGTKCTGSRY